MCFIILLRRFQPDKEFAGTDRNVRRDGPVQFERDEEDPFGLDKFLTEAKRAGKRTADEPRGSRFVYYWFALQIIQKNSNICGFFRDTDNRKRSKR